jgi:hypothetical protein
MRVLLAAAALLTLASGGAAAAGEAANQWGRVGVDLPPRMAGGAFAFDPRGWPLGRGGPGSSGRTGHELLGSRRRLLHEPAWRRNSTVYSAGKGEAKAKARLLTWPSARAFCLGLLPGLSALGRASQARLAWPLSAMWWAECPGGACRWVLGRARPAEARRYP